MRSHRSAICIVLGTLSLVLAACSGGGASNTPSSSTGKPILGGTLIAARDADVATWDPAYLNENFSLWASEQIAATMVLAAPRNKFLPYVAQSWDTSSDGTTTTFHLDPNAKFCDGTQITSDDVLFSYKYEAAHIQSWQFPPNMQTSAPDPETVVITTLKPFAPFLSFMSLYGTAMISHKYANRVGLAALATSPLGSGPFCLGQWQRGQEIDLVRNQYFWLKDAAGNRLPYLDAVHWKIISDDTARVLALESGQVQAVFPVPPSQVTGLKANSQVRVGITPLLGQATMFMNQSFAPFRDVNVRQALNYAVDRTAIVKAALLGYGLPAQSCLYLSTYTTNKYGYQYNPQKAKQLLSQTQWPNGFNVSVLFASGNQVASAAMVVVQQEFANIGVHLNLNPVEQGTFSTLWAQSSFQMVYNLGTEDFYDPAENLSFDMLPASLGGDNSGYTMWSDPQVSALVAQGLSTLDPTQRGQVYDSLQKLYMAEGPQVLLFNPETIWSYQNNVHGWDLPESGAQPFMNTWISPS